MQGFACNGVLCVKCMNYGEELSRMRIVVIFVWAWDCISHMHVARTQVARVL